MTAEMTEEEAKKLSVAIKRARVNYFIKDKDIVQVVVIINLIYFYMDYRYILR